MKTRKTIGLILFCIALGMVLMLFMRHSFTGIVIIGFLMLLGYNLYCD
ncbi:MAG: hypothetical protein HFI78_02390 [Lachnospiraceae bacterium]|nr:hypothetical protein [Lachnospiraceae bacterium]